MQPQGAIHPPYVHHILSEIRAQRFGIDYLIALQGHRASWAGDVRAEVTGLQLPCKLRFGRGKARRRPPPEAEKISGFKRFSTISPKFYSAASTGRAPGPSL